MKDIEGYLRNFITILSKSYWICHNVALYML